MNNIINKGLILLSLALLFAGCQIQEAVSDGGEELTDFRGISLNLEGGLDATGVEQISVRISDNAEVIEELSLDPVSDAGRIYIETNSGPKQLDITYAYAETEGTSQLMKLYVPSDGYIPVVIGTGGSSSRATETAGGVPTAYVTSINLQGDFIARGIGISDQGDRGTCSVHAMTTLLEYQYAGMFGSGYADLSEEYLNYYAQIVAGATSASHGDGAYFWMVEDAYNQYGVTTEAQLPYVQSEFHFDLDAELITSSMRSYARTKRNEAKNMHGLKGRFLKPNDSRNVLSDYEFNEIKNYLRMGIPVAMGRSHSIALVGYDDATELFTYKNSWGAGWGSNGYGTYTYDDVANNCNDLYVYYNNLTNPREYSYNRGNWEIVNAESINYKGLHYRNNALWINQYISADDANQNLEVKFSFVPLSDDYEIMLSLYRKNKNQTSGWGIFDETVSVAYLKNGSNRASWLRTNTLDNVISSTTPPNFVKGSDHNAVVQVVNNNLTFTIDGQTIFNAVSIASYSSDKDGYVGFTNYHGMSTTSEYYIYNVEVDRI